MTKRTKRSSDGQSLLYLWRALGYRIPEEIAAGVQENAYAYYAPLRPLSEVSTELQVWTENGCRLDGRFLYTQAPLSWVEIEAARLVPANLLTSKQLALAYDQHACEDVPMVWCKMSLNQLESGGEMIAWYRDIELWGSTYISIPEGRLGTAFAHTREPLVEAALRSGYIPSPLLGESVMSLPGMHEIHPVYLERGESVATPTPLRAAIEAHDVRGAATEDPWIHTNGQSAEWLVSLLYEDRCMALSLPSDALPTVEQALVYALDVAGTLTDPIDRDAWRLAHATLAERLPYEVALMQTRSLQSLLGSTYSEMLVAAHNKQDAGDHGPATDRTEGQDAPLHGEQGGRARYTQHAFFSPLS